MQQKKGDINCVIKKGNIDSCNVMAPPPHSTFEYNIIIANENEEYVCFSGMWWVPKNKLAYMEPLCAIPEYQHRGLASVALTKHYQRC